MAKAGEQNRSIEYITEEGGKVKIPVKIYPFRELGLRSETSSPNKIKHAYRERANNPNRQARVMASLSYHILTTTVDGRYAKLGHSYTIENADQFVFAATGYTEMFFAPRREFDMSQTDEQGRTLLYIAARGGFYDTTKALLEAGARVNQRQNDGSTPLHGAAYYGQVPVVKLLLRYGADSTIKNKWGSTPADETRINDVQKIISDNKGDNISAISRTLIDDGLATNTAIISYKGEEIAIKIIRNYEKISSLTKQDWENILHSWEPTWHGTQTKHLQSIFTHGLVQSGKAVGGYKVTPPSNHFKLGEACFGKQNWVAAIFVTPSILYALNACYAERVLSNGEEWCVVIRARVKPGSYTEHDPTNIPKPTFVDDMPENSEYNITPSENDKIQRVEFSRNVVVTSIVFIKTTFLDSITKSKDLDYWSLQQLFGKE